MPYYLLIESFWATLTHFIFTLVISVLMGTKSAQYQTRHDEMNDII